MSQTILLRSEEDKFIDSGLKIPRANSRSASFEGAEITDDRTLELSVSSELPYLRHSFWGSAYYEEWAHDERSIDLSRFNDSAMLLFNHNRDQYIGVIQRAWVNDKKLMNVVRFDTHDLAEQIYQSVKSGIIKNVSIGYEILELEKTKEAQNEPDTYRANLWMPFETSLVTVPADASVGVGRKYYNLSPTPSHENSSALETTELDQQSERELSGTEDSKTELPLMVDTPTIDVEQERQLERDRIRNIQAGGKKFNCPELAEQAVEGGISEQDFFRQVLQKQNQQQPQEPVAGVVPVGMSNNERKKYSVLRAVGYAAGHIPESECGLELEVSREIQKRNNNKPTKGIYIDQSELVAYRAPYETGVPAAAGNLIETELLSERFIDQLVNESAFMGMGITYLRDLTGNVEIPRESTFTTGYWVGEKQTIPEDEGTFDKIAMSPKKLAVLTKYTFEMTEQSSIDLEAYARRRLLRGLALELDRTIGFGSGVGNEPLGIASHPETKSIVLGANGGALDWAALIAMQAELFANNAMGNMGYVLNARTKAKLQTTLDQTTGSGNWIWQTQTQGDGTIAGYRAKCSNQIPNNLSKGTANDLTAVFFGDFSQVMVGMWSGMEILANPYSEFSEAIIQVRAMQLLDLQLTRGDYFCVASDVQNN